MPTFSLFASPWWVNLLIFVPFVAHYFWRRNKLELANRELLWTAIFAIAFGFVEAAAVIHLRAATGFLPGYQGTLSDVARLSSDAFGQLKSFGALSKSLFEVEFFREIATIVMLVCVAQLVGKNHRCRWAIFLWIFAVWDVSYYAWLWILISWPLSFTTPDVLFLVPVPWLSQVWFPLLVSSLTIGAVLLSRK